MLLHLLDGLTGAGDALGGDRRDYPWSRQQGAADQQRPDQARETVRVERFSVDVGAYAGRAAAEDRAAQIRQHFEDVEVRTIDDGSQIRYRVMTGLFRKEGGAKARIKALGELGFDTEPMSIRSFIVEEEIGGTPVTLAPLIKRPDQRKGDGRINVNVFKRPLNIATQLQYRPSFLGNFDLSSRSTDTIRFRNSFRLEGLWKPHDKVAIFAQGRVNWNVRETQRQSLTAPGGAEFGGCGDPPTYPRRCDENSVQVVRGETWLLLHDLWDVPAMLQIGRQRFRDDREWWWDANLDAVRLYHYGSPALLLEAAVASEVAQLSPDDSDIQADDDDVLRILGHFRWRWAQQHYIDGFALYHNDSSGLPPIIGEVPPDLQDDIDRDMVWFGLRASGKWKPSARHRLYYWLDTALVKGTEVEVDYDFCPIGLPNCLAPNDNDFFHRDVQGWAVDLGTTWVPEWPLSPSFTFGYAIGSGDGNPSDQVDPHPGTDGGFRQTGLQGNNGKFRGVDRFRYYGELFRPELSNMHIGTIAVGFPLWESSSIEILWHIYEQVNEATFLRDASIGARPNGTDRDLGQEIDVVMGIEEWEHIELELTGGVFRAGDAFESPAFTPRGGSESGAIATYFEFKFEYNF